METIWHAKRYWTSEPKGDEQLGWNTDFVACPVFKVTAKRVGVLSPYLGILWLNRDALEREDKVYHSKPHEWFFKIKPARDPEHPGPKYYEFMAQLNGKPQAFTALGLQAGCTRADVKRAYKRLATKAHPDTGGSHEAFIKLNQAYEDALRCVS